MYRHRRSLRVKICTLLHLIPHQVRCRISLLLCPRVPTPLDTSITPRTHNPSEVGRICYIHHSNVEHQLHHMHHPHISQPFHQALLNVTSTATACFHPNRIARSKHVYASVGDACTKAKLEYLTEEPSVSSCPCSHWLKANKEIS